MHTKDHIFQSFRIFTSFNIALSVVGFNIFFKILLFNYYCYIIN